MEIIVNSKGRIDKVLAKQLESKQISRTYLQKLISNNAVLLNGNKIDVKQVVNIGDIITIDLPKTKVLDVKPQYINFKIVYEDEDIVIIDKPNDLVVHPSESKKDFTLVNGLLNRIKNLSDINGIIRPGIVHRIDKQTTGLLVVAKNNSAHKFLSKALEKRELKRHYLVIVHGNFTHKTGSINAPIGRDHSNRKKMAVTAKNSKNAITNFKVVKNYHNFSLLKCELDTGRTHQIRVHMNYINHPVYGDNIYGKLSDRNNTFGQYLHAYKLVLIHPKTKEKLTFKAELPKEFLTKLNELERE